MRPPSRPQAARLAGLALAAALVPPAAPAPPRAAARAPLPAPLAGSWPMFGGTPGRNLANPAARRIPAGWDVTPGARRNVRWAADLGTGAYGSPVVAGGRVFI